MRARALLFLAPALLFSVAVSAETPPQTPAGAEARPTETQAQVLTLMDLGVAYAESERWGPAIERFQQVLNLNPQFAPAHYGLGRVYYMQQKYDEAERELLLAVKLNPNFEGPYVVLSLLSQATGDRRGAIRYLEQAVAILKARPAQPGEADRTAAPSPKGEPALLEKLERRLEKLKSADADKKP